MTNKLQNALDVLCKGGRIFYHSDKEVRLRDSNGNVVKGFGIATFRLLLAAGHLNGVQTGFMTVYTKNGK